MRRDESIEGMEMDGMAWEINIYMYRERDSGGAAHPAMDGIGMDLGGAGRHPLPILAAGSKKTTGFMGYSWAAH